MTRSSILRSVAGCWICLGYFFRFTFIINHFSSPNIFKLMERQLCTQMSVWQQGYNNNVCHVVWMFWLTLGRSFVLFLCTFVVDFEYYLFIVGATLMTYLCGKPKRDYIYGSSCKTLVSNSANDKGVLQRYLFISCYDNVIFNFYYLILEKLVQSH